MRRLRRLGIGLAMQGSFLVLLSESPEVGILKVRYSISNIVSITRNMLHKNINVITCGTNI